MLKNEHANSAVRQQEHGDGEEEDANNKIFGTDMEETILVKVNTARLEAYLQAIKLQMSTHEARVREQYETSIFVSKQEATKIAELSIKLQHCAVDVNSIRDFILNKGESIAGNQEKTTQSSYKGYSNNSDNLYLQAEVENLRHVVRRIELHQAEELDNFFKIRQLQQANIELSNQLLKLKEHVVIAELIEKITSGFREQDIRLNALTRQQEQDIYETNNKLDQIEQVIVPQFDERLLKSEGKLALLEQMVLEDDESSNDDDELCGFDYSQKNMINDAEVNIATTAFVVGDDIDQRKLEAAEAAKTKATIDINGKAGSVLLTPKLGSFVTKSGTFLASIEEQQLKRSNSKIIVGSNNNSQQQQQNKIVRQNSIQYQEPSNNNSVTISNSIAKSSNPTKMSFSAENKISSSVSNSKKNDTTSVHNNNNNNISSSKIDKKNNGDSMDVTMTASSPSLHYRTGSYSIRASSDLSINNSNVSASSGGGDSSKKRPPLRSNHNYNENSSRSAARRSSFIADMMVNMVSKEDFQVAQEQVSVLLHQGMNSLQHRLKHSAALMLAHVLQRALRRTRPAKLLRSFKLIRENMLVRNETRWRRAKQSTILFQHRLYQVWSRQQKLRRFLYWKRMSCLWAERNRLRLWLTRIIHQWRYVAKVPRANLRHLLRVFMNRWLKFALHSYQKTINTEKDWDADNTTTDDITKNLECDYSYTYDNGTIPSTVASVGLRQLKRLAQQAMKIRRQSRERQEAALAEQLADIAADLYANTASSTSGSGGINKTMEHNTDNSNRIDNNNNNLATAGNISTLNEAITTSVLPNSNDNLNHTNSSNTNSNQDISGDDHHTSLSSAAAVMTEYANLYNNNNNNNSSSRVRSMTAASIVTTTSTVKGIDEDENYRDDDQQQQFGGEQFNEIQKAIKIIKKDIRKIVSSIDNSTKDQDRRLEKESTKTRSDFTSYKTQMTKKMNDMKDVMTVLKAETKAKFLEQQETIASLEQRISMLEHRHVEAEKNLIPIVVEQQRLDAKTISLDTALASTNEEISRFHDKINVVIDTSNSAMESNKSQKELLLENAEYYDVELKHMRNHVTDTMKGLADMKKGKSVFVAFVEDKVLHMLDEVDNYVQRLPTALELQQMCMEYEAMWLRLHHEGPESSEELRHLPDKLHDRIAQVAVRIAFHVAAATDRLVLAYWSGGSTGKKKGLETILQQSQQSQMNNNNTGYTNSNATTPIMFVVNTSDAISVVAAAAAKFAETADVAVAASNFSGKGNSSAANKKKNTVTGEPELKGGQVIATSNKQNKNSIKHNSKHNDYNTRSIYTETPVEAPLDWNKTLHIPTCVLPLAAADLVEQVRKELLQGYLANGLVTLLKASDADGRITTTTTATSSTFAAATTIVDQGPVATAAAGGGKPGYLRSVGRSTFYHKLLRAVHSALTLHPVMKIIANDTQQHQISAAPGGALALLSVNNNNNSNCNEVLDKVPAYFLPYAETSAAANMLNDAMCSNQSCSSNNNNLLRSNSLGAGILHHHHHHPSNGNNSSTGHQLNPLAPGCGNNNNLLHSNSELIPVNDSIRPSVITSTTTAMNANTVYRRVAGKDRIASSRTNSPANSPSGGGGNNDSSPSNHSVLSSSSSSHVIPSVLRRHSSSFNDIATSTTTAAAVAVDDQEEDTMTASTAIAAAAALMAENNALNAPIRRNGSSVRPNSCRNSGSSATISTTENVAKVSINSGGSCSNVAAVGVIVKPRPASASAIRHRSAIKRSNGGSSNISATAAMISKTFDNRFRGDKEEEQAEENSTKLSSTPLLSHPVLRKSFTYYCDEDDEDASEQIYNNKNDFIVTNSGSISARSQKKALLASIPVQTAAIQTTSQYSSRSNSRRGSINIATNSNSNNSNSNLNREEGILLAQSTRRLVGSAR